MTKEKAIDVLLGLFEQRRQLEDDYKSVLGYEARERLCALYIKIDQLCTQSVAIVARLSRG